MSDTGINQRVIDEIGSLAEKYRIEQVLLFGSRARGDFHRASDIDLAAKGGDFARFALDVDEETFTLLKFDVVNLDDPINEDLRNAIEEEGITLYEKI